MDRTALAQLRHLRLAHHGLVRPSRRQPAEVVAHFGAMQAQDFAMAKWAVALRSPGATEADIAAAFDAGDILRIHVMRPTWHFVTPADIRWLVQLTGPRLRAQMAGHDRRHGVNPALLRRSRTILERALRGGKNLTREELQRELARHGIAVAGVALAQVMIHAELEALVCSGPRRGKQSTYALLEERVPRHPILDREAARAELARRYFRSHGPATARDFSWWSGQSLTEARTAIASLGRELSTRTVDGTGYFLPADAEPAKAAPGAWLLPNFDEFTVGYAERSLLVEPARPAGRSPRAHPIFTNVIVIGGRIAGTWSRTLGTKGAKVTLKPASAPAPSARVALGRAADRFRAFAAAGS